MATQLTWSVWFTNHPSNDAGNLNLKAYSDTLSSGDTEATKLQQVTEEIDTDILATNASNGIIMLHSPKNFGGTRTRPANKLVCMVGIGSQAFAHRNHHCRHCLSRRRLTRHRHCHSRCCQLPSLLPSYPVAPLSVAPSPSSLSPVTPSPSSS
jgi:hypothetical protein